MPARPGSPTRLPGGLVLPAWDVRATFLVGGLLTVAAFAAPITEWLLPPVEQVRPAESGRTVESSRAEHR